MPSYQAAILFVLFFSAATTQAAESPCRPCPGATTEVAVQIVSAGDFENFRLAIADDRSYHPPSWLGNGGKYVVSKSDSLRDTLKLIAGKCQRIGFLRLDSHVDLGYVAIGNGGFSVGNVEQVLEGLDCVMTNNARIEFGGCNVGRGCRGEDFLAMVAAQLLRRGGGTVSAFTNYAITIAGSPNISFDTQELTVGPGLTVPTWKNEPQSAAACLKRTTDALGALKKRRAGIGHCSSSIQANELLEAVFLDQLSQLVETNSRTAFDRTHLERAQRLSDAFSIYHSLPALPDGGLGPKGMMLKYGNPLY